MGFKERLAEAMADANVGPTQLAKELDVSYQAVSKVVAGTSKSLTAENTAKAAAFLNVSTDWLAAGIEPKARGSTQEKRDESGSPAWEAVCRSSVDLIDSEKAREIVRLFIAAVDQRVAALSGSVITIKTD